MTRPAFIMALIISAAPSIVLGIALGAPALAQPVSRTDPPTRTYATPAPAEGPAPECRAEIDCAPDLAGAPAPRPSRTWSVRTGQVPADVELQPYYPIAIVADVDAEGRDRRDDDHRHRRRPDLRHDD